MTYFNDTYYDNNPADPDYTDKYGLPHRRKEYIRTKPTIYINKVGNEYSIEQLEDENYLNKFLFNK